MNVYLFIKIDLSIEMQTLFDEYENKVLTPMFKDALNIIIKPH
jgi:hypothetical protein